jgi:hypothetical protein
MQDMINGLTVVAASIALVISFWLLCGMAVVCVRGILGLCKDESGHRINWRNIDWFGVWAFGIISGVTIAVACVWGVAALLFLTYV